MEPPPVIIPITDNLRAVVRSANDNPQAVIVHLQARVQEEPVAFRITTAVSIISHFWELPQLKGGNWLMLAEEVLADGYRLMIDRAFLDHPLIIGLELDTPSDPISSVLKIETWNGTGGTPVLIYVERD